MPKKAITWRLDPGLIAQLEEEADEAGIDVTALVEEKLGARPQLDELLHMVSQIKRELQSK
jgi:hypothetical protein